MFGEFWPVVEQELGVPGTAVEAVVRYWPVVLDESHYPDIVVPRAAVHIEVTGVELPNCGDISLDRRIEYDPLLPCPSEGHHLDLS